MVPNQSPSYKSRSSKKGKEPSATGMVELKVQAVSYVPNKMARTCPAESHWIVSDHPQACVTLFRLHCGGRNPPVMLLQGETEHEGESQKGVFVAEAKTELISTINC
jgi:hypothetical protein